MIIKGKNIFLRAFEIDDAKWLQEIRQDFEGLKGFAGSPFPSNLESEKEWISNMYPKGERKSIFLAIIENGSKQFSGYCVARNIDYINSHAEVGIILHKNARGKGFFKDVSFAFYDYLFGQINLNKLYSFVLESNEIALNTDKKIGFSVEGLIKEHIFQDGEYKDVHFVSLYKNEFNKKHGEFVSGKGN